MHCYASHRFPACVSVVACILLYSKARHKFQIIYVSLGAKNAVSANEWGDYIITRNYFSVNS